MLSCKNATRLMSEARDRELAVAETLGLEVHLLLCGGCRRYRRQMAFLHEACRQHPARVVADDEKSGERGS